MLQKGGGIHLPGLVVELDEGELRDPIYSEEHVDLAVRMAQLAAIDVDIADHRLGKAAALRHRLAGRQAGNAMTREAAVQA